MTPFKTFLFSAVLLFVCVVFTSSAMADSTTKCTPSEQPSLEEYLALSEQLTAHSRRYYRGESSQITAYQYEQLVMQIQRWESCFPELTDNAYFLRVQGEQGRLPKRLYKMRSLHKTYDQQEVNTFLGDVFGEYPTTDFIVQPKIDGMALELIYRNGHLVEAATRGDGWRGESVLKQIQRITTLPMVVDNPWQSLTVRGELFADAECAAPFIRKTPYTKQKATYADLRQFAVATALSDTPDLVQASCLRFVAYEWLECNLANDSACLDALQYMSFPTLLAHTRVFSVNDTETVATAYQEYQSSVADFGFLTDGVVIKANSLLVRKQMGATEKAPHWAIALKYQQVSAISEILNISVSYGRTGKVTPLIHIKPIVLAGRRISKLSGHSVAFMQKNQLGIGSHIEVKLQGGAVPMYQQTHIPTKNVWQFTHARSPLPLCLAIRPQKNDSNESCHTRLIKQIAHFVSKKGINVSGLGEKSIQRLIQAGVLQSVSDIFLLPSEVFTTHLGWNKQKAKAFVLALTNRRLLSFQQQLIAIGFPKFTRRDIDAISSSVYSLQGLLTTDVAQLPVSQKKRMLLQTLLHDKITRQELQALAQLFRSSEVHPING